MTRDVAHRLALLVRIWLVDSDEGERTWVGRVTRLPEDDDGVTVQSPEDLARFLNAQLRELGVGA